MSSEIENKKSDWLTFIEKFATNQMKVLFQEDEKGSYSFSIDNILETEIDISNKYGFLSVNFGSHCKRDEFLVHSQIEYDVKKLEKFTFRNTRWLTEDYPCRVFISDDGKMLSFYDSKEHNSIEEITSGRITVFRNVISAIIQLKIDAAIQ